MKMHRFHRGAQQLCDMTVTNVSLNNLDQEGFPSSVVGWDFHVDLAIFTTMGELSSTFTLMPPKCASGRVSVQ